MSDDVAARSTGHSVRFLVVAVLTVGGAVGIGWGIGKFRASRIQNDSTQALIGSDRRGELLFRVYCASCHGPEGKGDGSSTVDLRPGPRDFTTRPWRFEPTEAAIRKVILEGIPGTAMPSFRAVLSPADLGPLVEHVLHLATRDPPSEWSQDNQLLRDAGFLDLRGTFSPALNLSDAAGKTFHLKNFQEQLVLLHFWGSTCTHCIEEMPTLAALEKACGPERFRVLHICTDKEDAEQAQTLLDKHVAGVRAYVASSGLGLARFEVQALPTVWLIDSSGQAIGRTSGAKDWTVGPCRKLIERWLPSKNTVGGK